MSALASHERGRDGRLWAVAFGLSLLLNVAILGLAGFASIKSQMSRKARPVPVSPVAEKLITIFPELSGTPASAAEAVKSPPDSQKARFSRTSPDQAATPPASAAFIGERDTVATSDRAPDPNAPDLPSQSGIEPRSKEDLETTQSAYRDGKVSEPAAANNSPALPSPPPVPAAPPMPEATAAPAPGEVAETSGKDPASSRQPPAETLLQGNNPVDVPVPRAPEDKREIKPTPPKQALAGKPAPKAADAPKPPAPKPVSDPAFAGYQRKAAIVGSISRTGRSALNVADSPLGRYQAIISRAVELEWQRNCVRHRDFITPGFLTVRFFVETSGKVRTVQFVGQMETGEVQKGFTLNSIRDADIPPMPAAVRSEFDKQPLELIFNFYF